MERLTLMVKESYNELIQHVSWPTMEELLESSIVVLVASVLISVITFLMDVGASAILRMIYDAG